jgi:hypothetical protein
VEEAKEGRGREEEREGGRLRKCLPEGFLCLFSALSLTRRRSSKPNPKTGISSISS